jgi:hypothetical protein
MGGICEHTKKGQQMAAKAVKKSQRLDSFTKNVLRDKFRHTEGHWKYTGRKYCVCGR